MLTPLAHIRRKLQAEAEASERLRKWIRRAARIIAYDLNHQVRAVCYRHCREMIERLGPQSLDVLEISAGPAWRGMPFHSYSEMNFPEHDICTDVLDGQFDLVIADQVFEHLLWPYRAARNVLAMLRPGGHFLMMTPFLIRVHEAPHDCTRWTETGMRYFLAECGFDFDTIATGSWGNTASVKANLVAWARVGWQRNFPNDPRYPVAVWALAQKPPSPTSR